MRPRFLPAAVLSAGALATILACTRFEAKEGSAVPDGEASNEADAGGAALDGPTPVDFCADHTTALICDDFERSAVDGAWAFEQGTGSARLEIDGTFSTSSSRSLRVTLSGQAGFRYLHYALPSTKRIELSFSMRFGAEARGVQLAAIGFEDTPKSNVFIQWSMLENELSTLLLSEQDYPNGTDQPDRYSAVQIGRPPVGAFLRYTLAVDLEKNEAQVTSDGRIEGTLTLKNPHTKPVLAKIGNVYSTSRSEDVQVWIDDVVIR